MRAFHILSELCGVIALMALSVGASLAQEAPAAPAIDVAATKVQATDWTEKVVTVGIAEARQGVDVSISQSGLVAEILFDSGEQVKEGQPLVRLDISKEKADLESINVQIPAAKADLDRKKKLVVDKIVSQTDVDNAQARFDQLTAQAISLKATIERRLITAPFSGIIGIRKVNKGQYLQPGHAIANLQDLSVMRMRLLVSQKDFAKVSIGQAVEAHFDAYPDEVFEGKVTTIEPEVKFGSGGIPVQAEIPNSDFKLLAGMFATVDLVIPKTLPKIIIPQSAVSYNLYGTFVFVLNEKGKDAAGKPILESQRVAIELGERRGNVAVVNSGLKEGDLVVVAGQLKLSNGTRVNVVDGQTLPEMAGVPIQ